MGPPRLAIIGCGAIAEAFFLPALTSRRDLCSKLWIVDSNLSRLASVSKQFGVELFATSLDELLDEIDAGIICTPHETHYPIGMKLIAANKHVFCEKPLTAAPHEAERLVEAAEQADVVLMTNNWRRNAPAMREIKRIIETRMLGKPLSALWAEGKKFDWPTKSGFYFTQKSRDGLPPPGVLLDIGAHTVDLFCWWFGTSPEIKECWIDSFGGPEARATLKMDFEGVRTRTELSYYQKLSNTYNLRFERGSIDGGIYDPHLIIRRPGKKSEMVGKVANFGMQMLENFVDALAGRADPLTSGREVLPSIQTISQAYNIAQRYDAPWLPRPVI